MLFKDSKLQNVLKASVLGYGKYLEYHVGFFAVLMNVNNTETLYKRRGIDRWPNR